MLAKVREFAVDKIEPLLLTPEGRPVWELATQVMGHDPLRDVPVTVPTEQILANGLRVVGEEQRLAQLEQNGVLAEAATWVDTQLARFGKLLDKALDLFRRAWDALKPANLGELPQRLPDLARDAVALVGEVKDLGRELLVKALALVKNALLSALGEQARGLRGYNALVLVLGADPVTGKKAPPTPENLIKAFITLLPGGEATYDQLAQTGVIGSAGARIQAALSTLGMTWDGVVALFRGVWDSLTLDDLVAPLAAFQRVLDTFGVPLGKINAFVVTVVEVVVGLAVAVMGFPADLVAAIVANAKAAIADIKKDPLGFLRNLLAALLAGVGGFLDRFDAYLADGLVAWLTRGLSAVGVAPPKEWSLTALFDLVLQVLRLSEEFLWRKLSERLGQERVAALREGAAALGEAWAFLDKVRAEGIGALADFLSDKVSVLWDSVVESAKTWVMETVVARVATKLASMLDPTGVTAVVNSCLAFFKAVQSAVEYLKEILQIVHGYVLTIADIAKGNLVSGARKVESGLAAALPVAIGFLANQVGLSNVPEKLAELVEGVRSGVEKAVDWLLDQAVALGGKALGFLGGPGASEGSSKGDGRDSAVVEVDKSLRIPFEVEDEKHEIYINTAGEPMVASPEPHHTVTELSAIHSELGKLLGEYRSLRKTDIKAANKALREMARIVRENSELFLEILNVRFHAPNIGEIRTYNDQGAGFKRSTKQWNLGSYAQQWETTAEHVIPRFLVNVLLSCGGSRLGEYTSSDYDEAITIMVYHNAAKEKTGKEKKYGKELRGRLNAEALAPARRWEIFEEYATKELQLTKSEVKAEGVMNKDFRPHMQRPSDTQLTKAYWMQRAQILSIYNDRQK